MECIGWANRSSKGPRHRYMSEDLELIRQSLSFLTLPLKIYVNVRIYHLKVIIIEIESTKKMVINISIKVIIVLFLVTSAESIECPPDSGEIKDTCINCTLLPYTTITDPTVNMTDSCECLPGYEWSSSNITCLLMNQNHSANGSADYSSPNISTNNSASLNISGNCSIANCLLCQNNSCFQCSPSYELNISSSQCVLPLCQNVNCLVCSNKTCQFCEVGYLLTLNNICVLCGEGCQICFDLNSCISCNPSYTLDADFCYKQSCNLSNCQYCPDNNCFGCIQGYQLDPSGNFCYQVPKVCNDTKCFLACQYSGYICLQLNDTCGFGCSSQSQYCLVPNCEFCMISVCYGCTKGYYLSEQLCILDYCDIDYCSICNSTSSCGQCYTNYVYNFTTSQCIPACLPQSPNCISCENSTYCLLCQPGYSKSDLSSFCIATCTIENCYICLSINTCSSCLQGYQLNTSKSSCKIICTVINCNNCQNSTVCLDCFPNFSLLNNTCIRNCAVGSISIVNGSKISCYACSRINSFCLECTFVNKSLVCNKCSFIAYISINNSCIMCNSSLRNCIQCNSSVKCLSCAYPYSLVNGLCITVPCNVANCLLCSKYSPNICTLCSPGSTFISSSLCWPPQCPSNFFLTDGIYKCPLFAMIGVSACIACMSPFCISCSAEGCLSCTNSFYLTFNKSCFRCPSNCVVCTSIVCSQCSYGFSLQNDGSCLQVGGGISSVNINGQFVLCGPGCLVCVVGISNQIICLKAQAGYSLVNGAASKCLHQLCFTCIPGLRICASCFEGYILISGSCFSCIDPNAVSCLPANLNYSLSCKPTYSVGTFSTSLGRHCLTCAANCLKCDVNGPGNCDSNQCMLGFVLLKGSLNCTACFNSCSVCDQKDLNICLDCGPHHYRDNQGSCQSCSTRCQACISAVNCFVCRLGYTLIKGLCQVSLSYPCAITGSYSQCGQCFHGYILNGSECILGQSHNDSGNYTECPYGYLLADSLCFPCIILNCLACNESNECTFCKKGYFLFLGGCSSCKDNCIDCSSPNYCNQPADGYYQSNHADGSSRGVVLKCSSPCLTCVYGPDYCLTCADGYIIVGGACTSNNILSVKIVLAPSQLNQSTIFSSLDTDYIQLAKTIRNVNRLVNSFCQILSSSLADNSSCSQSFSIASIEVGSIVMNIAVDANLVKDVNATQKSIYQGLASNGIDGCTLISATITQSFQSDSVQPPNISPPSVAQQPSSLSKMPLILGISIGLGVFLVIIITIIAVVIKRKMVESTNTNSKQSPATNSIQIMHKQGHLFDKNVDGDKYPEWNFTPSPFLSVDPQISMPDEQNRTFVRQEEDDDDGHDEIGPYPRPAISKLKKMKPTVRKVMLIQRAIKNMVPP